MSWSQNVLGASVVSLLLWATAQAAEYTLTDLGRDLFPFALSEDGTVVGADFGAIVRAIVLTPGRLQLLPSLRAQDGVLNHGEAHGANGGEVVGVMEASLLASHAFTWNAQQGTRDLGTLGGPDLNSEATAVNQTLATVGASQTAPGTVMRPVVWIGGQIAELGTLGGAAGFAKALSHHGDIVGESQTVTGEFHATLWTVEGLIVDLAPTLTDSVALGIAANRTVVGEALFTAGRHGFVWTPTQGLRALSPLPGHGLSRATGVNTAGVIVGTSRAMLTSGSPEIAVRWIGGVAEVLQTRIDAPGWTLGIVTAINEAGQIVGFGGSNQAPVGPQAHAFLLTPIAQLTVATAPVPLVLQLAGDYNNDGWIDQAGLAADSTVWLGIAGEPWRQLPGNLVQLVSGDLDGDGQDDLAGLSSDSRIWCMTDTVSWRQLSGRLTGLVAGDFDGAGFAQLAGVASDSTVYMSTALGRWRQLDGRLKTMVSAKLTYNGHDTLAGLAWDSRVYAMPDGQRWEELPGRLVLLGTSLEKLVGMSADGRWWQQGPRLGDWRLVP